MNPYFFPEVNHFLIQPLLAMDDSQLLALWQQYPREGKYSVAIFCRYTPQTFVLVNQIPSEGIAEYLFNYSWEIILAKLPNLQLTGEEEELSFSLGNWIEKVTKSVIEEHQTLQIIPPKPTLPARYFPLQFYLEQALLQIHPFYRLILVTKEKFSWQESQILDYFQQKGYNLSSQELRGYYTQAYNNLLLHIPDDIRSIYLE